MQYKISVDNIQKTAVPFFYWFGNDIHVCPIHNGKSFVLLPATFPHKYLHQTASSFIPSGRIQAKILDQCVLAYSEHTARINANNQGSARPSNIKVSHIIVPKATKSFSMSKIHVDHSISRLCIIKYSGIC